MAKPKKSFCMALGANSRGEIFELPGFVAVGMAGPGMTPLTTADLQPVPFGSELMYLPERAPVVWDPEGERLITLWENPFEPGERLFPVAAFNSPGYAATALCAYEQEEDAPPLPLFSYGACAWDGKGFVSACTKVDSSRRQDLRLMSRDKVRDGISRIRQHLHHNRLVKHLEKCALVYGCPAAKNFFIGREEAPLPTAPSCNAQCLGCLSLQKKGNVPHSQDRINFMPEPAEIVEVALWHLNKVPKGVVSFGQGCEGDPLLAASSVVPAIYGIRAQAENGTININTNAGRPDLLERCLDAGIDSVRVSINSFQKACYNAYFKPSYAFEDVIESIDLALTYKVWVSLNYLHQPGVTDSPQEIDALMKFLEKRPVSMIQWRNLNYDPLHYYKAMSQAAPCGPAIGMNELFKTIKKSFPSIKFGYFNPALARQQKG